KVPREVRYDPDLVSILEILTYAGQIDYDRNSKLLQLRSRTYTRELQQLWSVECAARENHFAAGADPCARQRRRVYGFRRRIGAIDVSLVDVLDSDRLCAFEQNASRKRVLSDREVVGELLLNAEQVISRTRPLAPINR